MTVPIKHGMMKANKNDNQDAPDSRIVPESALVDEALTINPFFQRKGHMNSRILHATINI